MTAAGPAPILWPARPVRTRTAGAKLENRTMENRTMQNRTMQNRTMQNRPMENPQGVAAKWI